LTKPQVFDTFYLNTNFDVNERIRQIDGQKKNGKKDAYMNKTIGIRREDKNEWERRAPLVPEDVKELKEKHGIKTIIQPSKLRVFPDNAYAEAGAEVNEDLGRASVILAIKEIPIHLFEKDKTYVFFSHTIKGQPYNMDMLKRMMELKCNLVDYERIVNEKGQRLIFFGRFAGLAGMIETLHAFGQKLKLQGFNTPFEKIKQAYQYASLEEAKKEIGAIGEEIDEHGFPVELAPLVVGFSGYGNVSRGAQEIFDLLPFKVISGHILDEMYENFASDNLNLYKVVFAEEDMFRLKQGIDQPFDLQDYYNHPGKYESQFEKFIPYLSVLVNCIYWTEDYPRLVTKEYLYNRTIIRSNLTLKVVGDISCDIDGSIEITHRATYPDNATFTYFAGDDRYEEGTRRTGITVMAVDNLPCEFPVESSAAFSTVLREYIPGIVSENFKVGLEQLGLPDPIRSALILP
jgi:alpha-aminoadipic semialdehyde synthase